MGSKLEGVIVPAAVPLDEAGEFDRNGLSRLLEFLLAQGVHGIFANGSMGGFALFPDPVQYAVIEAACEQVAGRAPVLAGASDTSTARVLERIRVIQRMNVDYLVVLAPYYYRCGQDELLRFFLQVADHSRKPVILYDNPRYTQNPIDVETVERLAQHPNIRGLKISSTDVLKWQHLLRSSLPRERFSLICGAEKMMSLGLRLGFDGITGGLHNIVPDLAVRLFEAARAGDYSLADRIQQKLNRVYGVFETDGGWRGLETAFQYMGICRKAAPPPFDLETPETKRRAILALLEQEGVLRSSR